MASRDLVNEISVQECIPPLLATASTTTGATAVDTQGYEGVTVVFNAGAVSAACTVTLSLVECATSGGTYTAVALGDIIGGALPAVNTGTANQVYAVGYRGSQRFIKGQIALGGTVSTGADVSCSVILSHGRHLGGSMNTLYQ